MNPSPPPSPLARLLLLALLALLSLCPRAAAQVEPLNIPDTPDNQRYFEVVDQVLDKGTPSHQCDSPGEQSSVISCIRLCTSPGPRRRDGCCCIGRSDGIVFGLEGQCRYLQLLRNFSESRRLDYVSTPFVDTPDSFFDNRCNEAPSSDQIDACSCRLGWQLPWSLLDGDDPLPTPSAAPSKAPTRTPRPSRSRKPSPSPSSSLQPSPSPSSTPPSTSTPSTSASSSVSFLPDMSSSSSPSQEPDTSPIASQSPPSASQTPPPTPASVAPDPPTTVSTSPSTSTSPSSSPSSTDGGDDEGPTDEDQGDPTDDEPEGSGVCIDERYLVARGFQPKDLVHKNGVWKSVYCPAISSLPCGTAFHKLRVAGVSTSYRDLCESGSVPCSRDVVKVNSVWTHEWQEVHHGEAVLTMYDVRYSEGAQRVLHRGMRAVRAIWPTSQHSS